MINRILGGIYLLSIDPINQNEDFRKNFGISHIISVVPGPLPSYLSKDYSHLQISITDELSTNLLEHLPRAIEFMNEALFLKSHGRCLESLELENPGNLESLELENPESLESLELKIPGNPEIKNPSQSKHQASILIHCAQGQSRSVAVIIAFLMYKYKLSYHQSLHAVKRKVPSVEPNEAFRAQIEAFKEMGFSVDSESAVYRRILAELSLKADPTGAQLRELGLWRSCGSDLLDNQKNGTSGQKIDITNNQKANPAIKIPSFHLRCKRCRSVLATENDVEIHEIPNEDSRQSQFIRTAANSRRVVSRVEASKTCSHHFVAEPLDWMKPELEKQEIEGKFSCPKCDAKVGGYSWKGSRCSCGKWMIPAVHLQSAKVDKMKIQA